MKVIKKIIKSIDWDLVQVVIIVGTVPIMLIVGALFYPFFTPNYS